MSLDQPGFSREDLLLMNMILGASTTDRAVSTYRSNEIHHTSMGGYHSPNTLRTRLLSLRQKFGVPLDTVTVLSADQAQLTDEDYMAGFAAYMTGLSWVPWLNVGLNLPDRPGMHGMLMAGHSGSADTLGVECLCASCVARTVSLAAAFNYEATAGLHSCSPSQTAVSQKVARLYASFAEKVKAAALVVGTVLLPTLDASSLLSAGRELLKLERGRRSLIHDLAWFYSHASGTDIDEPVVMDTLCFGLTFVTDNAGVPHESLAAHFLATKKRLLVGGGPLLGKDIYVFWYEQPTLVKGESGVWLKAEIVEVPHEGCHVLVKYVEDQVIARITLGSTFTHFERRAPVYGQVPSLLPWAAPLSLPTVRHNMSTYSPSKLQHNSSTGLPIQSAHNVMQTPCKPVAHFAHDLLTIACTSPVTPTSTQMRADPASSNHPQSSHALPMSIQATDSAAVQAKDVTTTAPQSHRFITSTSASDVDHHIFEPVKVDRLWQDNQSASVLSKTDAADLEAQSRAHFLEVMGAGRANQSILDASSTPLEQQAPSAAGQLGTRVNSTFTNINAPTHNPHPGHAQMQHTATQPIHATPTSPTNNPEPFTQTPLQQAAVNRSPNPSGKFQTPADYQTSSGLATTDTTCPCLSNSRHSPLSHFGRGDPTELDIAEPNSSQAQAQAMPQSAHETMLGSPSPQNIQSIAGKRAAGASSPSPQPDSLSHQLLGSVILKQSEQDGKLSANQGGEFGGRLKKKTRDLKESLPATIEQPGAVVESFVQRHAPGDLKFDSNASASLFPSVAEPVGPVRPGYSVDCATSATSPTSTSTTRFPRQASMVAPVGVAPTCYTFQPMKLSPAVADVGAGAGAAADAGADAAAANDAHANNVDDIVDVNRSDSHSGSARSSSKSSGMDDGGNGSGSVSSGINNSSGGAKDGNNGAVGCNLIDALQASPHTQPVGTLLSHLVTNASHAAQGSTVFPPPDSNLDEDSRQRLIAWRTMFEVEFMNPWIASHAGQESTRNLTLEAPPPPTPPSIRMMTQAAHLAKLLMSYVPPRPPSPPS